MTYAAIVVVKQDLDDEDVGIVGIYWTPRNTRNIVARVLKIPIHDTAYHLVFISTILKKRKLRIRIKNSLRGAAIKNKQTV